MTKRLTLIVAVTMVALTTISGLSSASVHQTYALGKATACRANYHKSTLTHLVKGKHVRYVACVYRAPVKPPSTTTTTDATPTTTTTVLVGATLPPPPPTTTTTTTTVLPETITVSITPVSEGESLVAPTNYGFQATAIDNYGTLPPGEWEFTSSATGPGTGSFASFASFYFPTSGTYTVTATYTANNTGTPGFTGSATIQVVIQ